MLCILFMQFSSPFFFAASRQTLKPASLLRRCVIPLSTSLLSNPSDADDAGQEYVLYAPLTERQREVYDAVLNGGLRSLLIAGKAAAANGQAAQGKAKLTAEELAAPRRTRSMPEQGKKGKKRKHYEDLDEDDDAYFERIERGGEQEADDDDEKGQEENHDEEEGHRTGRDWMYKTSGVLPQQLRLDMILTIGLQSSR